jgi:hypothetical protein
MQLDQLIPEYFEELTDQPTALAGPAGSVACAVV